MKCNQCQSEVNIKEWKFCPHCGGSLYDEKILYYIRKIFSSRRNILIFVFIQLTLFSILGYYVYLTRQEINNKNQEIADILNKQKEVFVEARLESEILPIAYVGDNKKLGEIHITSPIYSRLRIETEVENITEHDVQIVNIKPESKIIYLSPDITPRGYENISDSRTTNLNLKVTLLPDNGEEKVLLDKKQKIFFYSQNDIIWKDKEGNNTKYVVRLINKDKKEVKDLVRKAADHIKSLGGETNAMVGPTGDREEIKRQLEAIFLAISRDYQIRYVMAPFSYDDIRVQKIKSPEEVVSTKSGLCIELSLLTAAALENIGLNSVIVVTSGHAWVGVEVSPKSQDYIFIETTALDKTPGDAVNLAQHNWDEIKSVPYSYQLLNLNELRADGINPMEY